MQTTEVLSPCTRLFRIAACDDLTAAPSFQATPPFMFSIYSSSPRGLLQAAKARAKETAEESSEEEDSDEEESEEEEAPKKAKASKRKAEEVRTFCSSKLLFIGHASESVVSSLTTAALPLLHMQLRRGLLCHVGVHSGETALAGSMTCAHGCDEAPPDGGSSWPSHLLFSRQRGSEPC